MKHKELSMQDSLSLNGLWFFICAKSDLGIRRTSYGAEPEHGLVMSSNRFCCMGRKDTARWVGNSGSLWPGGFPALLTYCSISEEYFLFGVQSDGPLAITAMCYIRLETEIFHIQSISPEHGFSCTPKIFHLTSLVESQATLMTGDLGSLWTASSHCFANLSQSHK